MGMGSVDLAVLWPKNYGQFDVCYKPTSRLSQFASLGIPAVAYPFASYIDIFVRSCTPHYYHPTLGVGTLPTSESRPFCMMHCTCHPALRRSFW